MIIILGTFLIQRKIISRCTMILYIREHGGTLQKDNAPVQFCSPCIFYITLTLRSVLRVRIYMNSDPYHFASRIRVLTVYRVGLRKSQKTNLIRIPIYISGYLSPLTQNWILIKIKWNSKTGYEPFFLLQVHREHVFQFGACKCLCI